MDNPFVDSKKSKRKLRLILPAILMVAIFVGSVLAYSWIYSNVVHVTVGAYSFKGSLRVDDETPMLNQTITFSGTLYYDGGPAKPDLTIVLFLANGTEIASGLTNDYGNFSIVYNVTEIGDFDFKVGYHPSE